MDPYGTRYGFYDGPEIFRVAKKLFLSRIENGEERKKRKKKKKRRKTWIEIRTLMEKNSHARINLDTHKYFNCSSLRGNLVAHAVGRIVPVVDFAFNWPCSRIARVLRNRAWISVCKGNGAKERIEREREREEKNERNTRQFPMENRRKARREGERERGRKARVEKNERERGKERVEREGESRSKRRPVV